MGKRVAQYQKKMTSHNNFGKEGEHLQERGLVRPTGAPRRKKRQNVVEKMHAMNFPYRRNYRLLPTAKKTWEHLGQRWTWKSRR